MKIVITLLIILSLPLSISSQSIKSKDSLITIMCNEINKNKNLSDSLKVSNIYKQHLYPYLDRIDRSKVDSIRNSIYFRFQRNCPEFLKILNKNDPGNGDWEIIPLNEKPKSSASKTECKNLTKLKKLSYLEHSGDKVLVQIKDGFWIEKFIDGTYSKLNFNWINDCEFELEFIESNNEIRKNFSKKGDRYNYEIITKEHLYLSMLAFIPEQNIYLTFKIYYD